MLNPEGLAVVLQLVDRGIRIQDAPEYEHFLKQAAEQPNEALNLRRRELASALPSDVSLRSRVFAVMSEVTLAIAGSGAATDPLCKAPGA
jgi:hypothetical protein